MSYYKLNNEDPKLYCSEIIRTIFQMTLNEPGVEFSEKEILRGISATKTFDEGANLFCKSYLTVLKKHRYLVITTPTKSSSYSRYAVAAKNPEQLVNEGVFTESRDFTTKDLIEAVKNVEFKYLKTRRSLKRSYDLSKYIAMIIVNKSQPLSLDDICKSVNRDSNGEPKDIASPIDIKKCLDDLESMSTIPLYTVKNEDGSKSYQTSANPEEFPLWINHELSIFYHGVPAISLSSFGRNDLSNDDDLTEDQIEKIKLTVLKAIWDKGEGKGVSSSFIAKSLSGSEEVFFRSRNYIYSMIEDMSGEGAKYGKLLKAKPIGKGDGERGQRYTYLLLPESLELI